MALLTVKECVALYHEVTRRTITEATYRSYVSRGQLPGPKKHIGRTPMYDRDTLIRALKVKPRIGTVDAD